MSNEELVRRIVLSTNKLDGVYYLFAKYYGLNENTLAFLYALNDSKTHSQKEISDEWFIPRTTINSIVKNMLANGYINLVNEAHTKEKSILITAKGSTYINNLMTKIAVIEEKVIADTLAKFSPKFIEALEFFSHRLQTEFKQSISQENNQNHDK